MGVARRAGHLAVKAKLLSHDHVPDIPTLKEAPPRSGFFESEAFQVALGHLPPYIKPIALFAYELGWRLREVLGLQWHQLDLTEGYDRLNPGTTKNDEGRVAYFSPDLLPAGYTFVEATPAASYNNATGVWTVGGLGVNNAVNLFIEATVRTTGPYSNTASVTASSLPDPDPANNSATVDVQPGP